MNHQNSYPTFIVMLIDEDPICLSMLKNCYQDGTLQVQMVAIDNQKDAIAAIRNGKKAYDLVIADLNMLQMNGAELQKLVTEEFTIPFMIMSTNNQERVMLECLEAGAELYILKPIQQDALNDIWQYTLKAMEGKQMLAAANNSSSSAPNFPLSPSSSSVQPNDDSDDDDDDDDDDEYEDEKTVVENAESNKNSRKTPNKPKLRWTAELHTRFMVAIQQIGYYKAAPNMIRQLMNVPGLTRANVSSHLQKHRLLVKEIAAENTRSRSSNNSLMFPGSSSMLELASVHRLLMIDQQQNPQTLHEIRNSFRDGRSVLGSISIGGGYNRDPVQDGMNTGSIPGRFSFGQASLLDQTTGSNQWNPMFNDVDPLHQYESGLSGFGTNRNNIVGSYQSLGMQASWAMNNAGNEDSPMSFANLTTDYRGGSYDYGVNNQNQLGITESGTGIEGLANHYSPLLEQQDDEQGPMDQKLTSLIPTEVDEFLNMDFSAFSSQQIQPEDRTVEGTGGGDNGNSHPRFEQGESNKNRTNSEPNSDEDEIEDVGKWVDEFLGVEMVEMSRDSKIKSKSR